MNIGNFEYARCTRGSPCPICTRMKYCLVAVNGKAAICTKIQDGSIKTYSWKSGPGYLHFLQDCQRPKKIPKARIYRHDKNYIYKIWKGLDFSVEKLKPLADSFKIDCNVLVDLRVGYHPFKEAWCFPMYNAVQQLIGLSARTLDGDKWCIRHSALGVFIGKSFDGTKSFHVVEGSSDTAVMLSRGFNVMGRLSASTCNDVIKGYDVGKPIFVIADTDDDNLGLIQALILGCQLKDGHVIHNPYYKDVRKWIDSGKFTNDLFYEKDLI